MLKIYFRLEPFSLLSLIIFFILVYIGISLLFFQGLSSGGRAGRFILINIKSDISRMVNSNEKETEFINAGLKPSILKYYKRYLITRYIIFLFLLISLILKAITANISTATILLLISAFFVTSPKLKIGNHWTPFGYAMNSLNTDLKKKQDIELSGIIIQLQNIAVSQKDEPTTLTYMLSKVIRFSKYTREAFVKMILYLDQGKIAQARNSFIHQIDTPLSRDLAYILIQLDKIEPTEVINQLRLLEERVRKENLTYKNKAEEFYSNIMYIVPTLLCFIILLNFLLIVLNIVTLQAIAF